MSRDQIERAYEREQAALDGSYEDGEIGPAEHRRETRRLDRELQDALRQGLEDDLEAVRDEWNGPW